MNIDSRADKLIKLLLGEEELDVPPHQLTGREADANIGKLRRPAGPISGVKAKVFKAMNPATPPEEREQLLADPELASVADKIRARFAERPTTAPAEAEAAPGEEGAQLETTEDKLRAALNQKGGCCEICWTSSFAPTSLSDSETNVYQLKDGSGKVICQFCELTAALKQAQAERTAWQETAERAQRNTEFYHGVVTQIGEMFGLAAKTADDGTVGDSVLALKVPELVAALIKDIEEG